MNDIQTDLGDAHLYKHWSKEKEIKSEEFLNAIGTGRKQNIVMLDKDWKFSKLDTGTFQYG